MTSLQKSDAPAFTRDAGVLRDALARFGSQSIFQDVEEWIIEDNPYLRPLRPQAFKYLDFTGQSSREDQLNYTAMTANRILCAIYESDFVFLPDTDFPSKREQHYGSTIRRQPLKPG